MQAALVTHPATHPDTAPVVVVGLGDTGLSVARHLCERGEPVVVVDSRRDPPALAALREELPAVRVELGPFDPARMESASRLVVSPGVPLGEPAVARAAASGVEVLGDIELFAREVAAPVAAITGSNGKSTVTALLGDMAAAAGRRVRVGGNLGTPALDLLRDGDAELYVLELSSFQLERTWSLAPAVAAVLNLSPDHLDRYCDLAAYATAKSGILDGARHAVLNLDDPRVMAMSRPGQPRSGFSVHGAPGARAALTRRAGRDWLALDAEPILPVADVPVAGRHNLANALAAMALAAALEIPVSAMASAIAGFRALAHRCVPVVEQHGVRWIDDSKATNVGAAVAAIEGMASGRNLVLIAGGLSKQQDFSPLAAPLARHVHTLVVLGRDGAEIERVAPSDLRRCQATDMSDAVRLARAAARPGDVVLLSPACASFDMFASYAARGLAFADAVRAGDDA
jgi:UDP-N-acetylmuramoylalanine--D-glutamate ligase